jgi:site-specific DNA-methyltransferase (adenine-specific)
LTDPPYGLRIARDQTIGSRKNCPGGIGRDFPSTVFPVGDWDDHPATEEELATIGELTAHQIVWGGNYLPYPQGEGWFVWDKCRRDLGFADGEMARTSFDGPMRICTYRWNGMLQGKLQCNGRDKEKRWHPAQKPVPVMEWCINQATDRMGDQPLRTILDPYMGSGSTLVAAKLKGIHCVGIEQSEHYCQVAMHRLNQGVLDLWSGEANGDTNGERDLTHQPELTLATAINGGLTS